MDLKFFAPAMGLFLLSACGQDVLRSPFQVNPSINPILVEPGAGVVSEGPFGLALTRGTFAVTVNRALIGMGTETDGNRYALMRTLPGVNSPGAYYGLGLGNKAQIGMGLFAAGKSMDSFQSLSLKVLEPLADEDSENAHLSVNLLIDLNCDPLNPDYKVAVTDDFVPKTKGSWEMLTVRSSDRAFRWVRTSGSLKTLKDLTRAHPLACFAAADVFDLGMKRNQRLTPIQLVYGDRYYFKSTSLQVDDLSLQVGGESAREDFEL